MSSLRTWVPEDSTVAEGNPGVVDWMENYPQAYALWLPNCLTSWEVSHKIPGLWLFGGDRKAQPH